MAPISLQKLLKPRGELYRILANLLRPYSDSVAVFDAMGQILIGCATLPPGKRQPILHDGQILGWVQARENAPVDAAALAGLFNFLASQEADKKALTGELIERYRELSLHYHLSERLAGAPQPDSIARVALEETLHTIPAASGLILLERPDSSFEQITIDDEPQLPIAVRGLARRVMASGRADLANDVPGTEHFQYLEESAAENLAAESISLLCAPIKTEQHVLGAIVLLDHGSRVFTAGDLKLLNSIAMQAAPAIEISHLYQVAVEKARYERELQMARQVQESLLPTGMPQIAGWGFAHRWRPARQVSGDFYDLIDVSADGPGESNGEKARQRLGLIIADITDKGMPASLFSVFVRSALRASIRRSSSPAEAITYANQLVCQDSHEGLFATMVYVQVDIEAGEIQYVNAGHNPPIVYHAQTGDIQLLKRTGLPLGVDQAMHYRFESLQLAPGDFILFYTDGITEATGAENEEFGLERLESTVRVLQNCAPEQILNGVEAELAQFTASKTVEDDITLMVMKRM